MGRPPASVAIAIAAVLLLPLLAVRGGQLARDTARAVPHVLYETFHERRQVYGYCNGRGYGYVERIVDGMPDVTLLPALRYSDFNRYADVVLPGNRHRRDDRIVIGLDLDPHDLEEHEIAARAAGTGGRSAAQTWLLRTGADYWQMTGMRVDWSAPPAAGTLDITLYDLPTRRRILGRWRQPVSALASSAAFDLPDPVERFSISRGGTDFLLDLQAPGPVSAVAVRARKIDLRGYDVVHRDGRCLTAVRADFHSEIAAGGPWAAWLAGVRRRSGGADARPAP